MGLRSHLLIRFKSSARDPIYSTVYLAIAAWLGLSASQVNTPERKEHFTNLEPFAGHLGTLWVILISYLSLNCLRKHALLPALLCPAPKALTIFK